MKKRFVVCRQYNIGHYDDPHKVLQFPMYEVKMTMSDSQ